MKLPLEVKRNDGRIDKTPEHWSRHTVISNGKFWSLAGAFTSHKVEPYTLKQIKEPETLNTLELSLEEALRIGEKVEKWFNMQSGKK